MNAYTAIPITHRHAQPFRWEGRPPATLLLHGLTSTPWEVRPVGLALRAAGFHAESIWLPGHGTTIEDLARRRWADWTAAVEAHFDRMQAEHGTVAVMGSSLGGSLALWLASRRPVAAVVAMGAAAWLPFTARLAGPLSRIRPFVNKPTRGSAIFDEEARRLHPAYPQSSLRAIAEMWAFTRVLRGRIPTIHAPLLVMHARQDRVIPVKNAHWIYEHAGSPRKRCLILEHSDHIITEDVEQAIVTEAAVGWLESSVETLVEG